MGRIYMHDTVREHQDRVAKSAMNYLFAGIFVVAGLLIPLSLKWKIILILIGVGIAFLNGLGDKIMKKKFKF
ncbi:hypothetical protein KAR52_03060 [Candidatus Pacearchaeota archaeon]|nr:hypothetical protein [Candidatus Pacearchaeota archaeon]